MNLRTGEIYQDGEDIKRAIAGGDPVAPVSPQVAQLVRDGWTYQRQKARRRARNRAARAARKANRSR